MTLVRIDVSRVMAYSHIASPVALSAMFTLNWLAHHSTGSPVESLGIALSCFSDARRDDIDTFVSLHEV